MAKHPILELTTDLPDPPAPHLGPTIVLVDNADLRHTVRTVRVLNVALFGLPTLLYLVNSDADFGQKMGVLVAWASVMAFLCLRVWRPERARAGSNWLSVHDSRHWVELDKLTSLDKTGRSDRWVFYDARHRRELLDVSSLRRCPILFDPLVRGVMRAEEAGAMRTKLASEWLMWSAPPGYRKPERWDSDW